MTEEENINDNEKLEKRNAERRENLLKIAEKIGYKMAVERLEQGLYTSNLPQHEIEFREKIIEEIRQQNERKTDIAKQKNQPQKINIHKSDEEIEQANHVNLPQFLMSQGFELKRVGKEYIMKDHDSVHITDNAPSEKGKWFRFSQNKGGDNIAFVQEFMDRSFHESVELLNGGRAVYQQHNTPVQEQKNHTEQEIHIQKNSNAKRALAYLSKTRGLDYEMVKDLAFKGDLIQEAKTGNAVFLIKNESGITVGAEKIGTSTDRKFKGIAAGSTADRGFETCYGKGENALFFESAVDLLSYVQIHKNELDNHRLVSMMGVKPSVVETTMQRYNIPPEKVFVCSDNDEAGNNFAEKLREKYPEINRLTVEPQYKDWNDQLRNIPVQRQNKKEENTLKTFGNSYWNKAVGNDEKMIFYMNEDIFLQCRNVLENSGINYLTFIKNGMAVMAVQENETDKLKDIIGQANFAEMRSGKSQKEYVPPEKNIVGNTAAEDILLKVSIESETQIILKTAELLERENIKFSVEVNDDISTLTIASNDAEKAESLKKSVAETRRQHFPEDIGQDKEISGNAPYDPETKKPDISDCYYFISRLNPQEYKEIQPVLESSEKARFSAVMRDEKLIFVVEKAQAQDFVHEYNRVKNQNKIRRSLSGLGLDEEQIKAYDTSIEKAAESGLIGILDDYANKDYSSVQAAQMNDLLTAYLNDRSNENFIALLDGKSHMDKEILNESYQSIEKKSTEKENVIKPELTEQEKTFLNFDIETFLAKKPLAWDEIEDIGYILYEKGYIDKHKAHDNAIFGNGLSEPDLYNISRRMQNGEDVRKDLITGLLGNENVFTTNQGNKFNVSYGENEIIAKFGNAERSISYESLGNALYNLIEDEYNSIVHDRTVEDLTYSISDLTYETAEQLINAFDNAITTDWQGDMVKEDIIKKALYDILGDDNKTEKTFASIADMKYNYKPEKAEPVKEDFLQFSFGKDKDRFTESDLLADFVKKNPTVSFALANAVFEYLDEKQHTERDISELNAGWYKKTDFVLSGVINGKDLNYEGRFDIGDGKGTGGGSIIDHIRDFNQGIIDTENYPYNTPESKEQAQETLDTLIPFLEAHSQLTAEELQILADFKAENPIRIEPEIEPEKEIESNEQNKSEKSKKFYDVFIYDGESKTNEPVRCEANNEHEARKIGNTYISQWNLLDAEITDIQEVQTEREKSIETPTVSEIETVNKAENSYNKEPSQLFIDDVNTLDELHKEILRGSGVQNGKLRIQKFYEENKPNTKEFADFLKKEYGTGGHTADSPIAFVDHDSKGIQFTLSDENGGFSDEKFRFSWTEAAKMAVEIIEKGEYLSDKEQEKYNEFISENPQKTTAEKTENPRENESDISKKTTEIYVENAVKNTSPEKENKLEKLEKTKLDSSEKSVNTNENNAKKTEEKSENTDFHITDDTLGEGGAKTRFKANIAAIETLKTLEKENRTATNEEKETLSKYVGWGGLAQAFDSGNEKWSNEFSQLKSLLSDSEYRSAKASVLDSFYTPPVVIDSIYNAVDKFGFNGGNVLEPSCGVGNFIGKMPEEIRQNSSVYGVEIDSISGRIAKQIYPEADIQVKGFEMTDFQNGSFDVAVGNVPFGNLGFIDKEYGTKQLHDFFFAKTLDKLKNGGIAAFVTSTGTLDKADETTRHMLAEKADLIGAIRLPSGTFLGNAGTEVDSDIIFLQKRSEPPEHEPDWVHIGQTEDRLPVNKYFEQNPDMILGEMTEGNKLYGHGTICMPVDGADLREQLENAVQKLSAIISDERAADVYPKIDGMTVIPPENLRNFSFFEQDNTIYFKTSDRICEARCNSTNKDYQAVKAFIGLRDTTRELLSAQEQNNPDPVIKSLQEKLNFQYDSFTKKFGLLHSKTNKSRFADDISYNLTAALEKSFDLSRGIAQKADIFTKRTIKPPQAVDHADTAMEALTISLAEKACVDLDYMQKLTDTPKDVLITHLQGEIFPVPFAGKDEFQTAAEYLSGNIYQKLEIAENAAKSDVRFENNVRALKESIPIPLKAEDIEIQIGAAWIDPKVYQQFMYELLETADEKRVDRLSQTIDECTEQLKSEPIYKRFSLQREVKRAESALKNAVTIARSEVSGEWSITPKPTIYSRLTVHEQEYSTKRRSAYQIMEDLLNLREPKVYKTIVEQTQDGEKERRVLDDKATKAAHLKAEKIKSEFKDWLFKDPQRRNELVQQYNEKFNCIKPREYDGSNLTFPTMNADIELRPHQKNAVAHAMFGENTLFAHAVGAGKSATRL